MSDRKVYSHCAWCNHVFLHSGAHFCSPECKKNYAINRNKYHGGLTVGDPVTNNNVYVKIGKNTKSGIVLDN